MTRTKEKLTTLYSAEEIAAQVARVAAEITVDYKDAERRPLFVGVLKGAFVFMADLVRQVELPCRLDFMMAQSYGLGTVSSGYVRIVKDIETVIENRDVILVEDILDTANTLSHLCEILCARKPKSLKVCVFLDKKANRKIPFEADYSCFEIDDGFVVGYGLDYAEKYRNLPYLGVIEA